MGCARPHVTQTQSVTRMAVARAAQRSLNRDSQAPPAASLSHASEPPWHTRAGHPQGLVPGAETYLTRRTEGDSA